MTKSKDISKKQDQFPANRGSSRRLCPYCKSPTKKKDSPSFPFCSERCRMVDLGAWLGEKYKIPGQETKWGESLENGT